mmetsp:Transcript_8248/g.36483  ORF Transcript_8248/g.36483 Transcript_8248/m.36483 type:complete len:206 (-) Transcript_8248:610-1227(-)
MTSASARPIPKGSSARPPASLDAQAEVGVATTECAAPTFAASAPSVSRALVARNRSPRTSASSPMDTSASTAASAKTTPTRRATARPTSADRAARRSTCSSAPTGPTARTAATANVVLAATAHARATRDSSAPPAARWIASGSRRGTTPAGPPAARRRSSTSRPRWPCPWCSSSRRAAASWRTWCTESARERRSSPGSTKSRTWR